MKKSTIQLNKIKRWVIFAIVLNLVVIIIHTFFMVGGNWSSIKKKWNGLLQKEVVMADTVITTFTPISSYFMGHSYQPDHLLDTVSLKKHATYYTSLTKDATSTATDANYGIDVSRWQSRIDWTAVQKDTVPHALSFFIIKATQGDSLIDPYFKYNWKHAQGGGKMVGAYHFYTYQDNPKKQAQNFIDNVSLSPGNFRPVIDIELACASCQKPGVSKSKMIRDLKLFISVLESHYKVSPILYSYTYFYDEYLQKHFTDYTFWMAQYAIQPPPGMRISPNDSTPQPPHVAMWQFSSKGRVNGIIGNVDVDFIPSYELDDLLIK